MNYYNENTNKIRRRKVSSNDSVSKPVENKQSVERKSNNNNIKKEKVKPKNKPRNKNKVIKLISVVCLVALVICSAVGSVVTISALKGAPKVTKELIEDTYISSEIINVDEIPKDLKNALVAIEDQRFYEHKGVDYKSLIRSLLNNIFS
ncbi:MAG: transglycosylase domain-containing protein, partial [Romboutsia sp.]